MKKLFILILLCAASQLLRAQVENPGDAAKDGATDHVNNNISNGVYNGLNKTENAIKGIFKKKPKQQQQPQQPNTAQQQNNSVQKPADNAQQQDGSIKVYQNYDFVPGDKIIFDDLKNNALLTAIMVYMACEDPQTLAHTAADGVTWPTQTLSIRNGRPEDVKK